MNRLIWETLLLMLGLPALSAALDFQDKADSPAEQYQALLKEYGVASRDFRKATTDSERIAAIESMNAFTPRFVTLAEKYPTDPAAIEALTQAIRLVNSVDSLTQTA